MGVKIVLANGCFDLCHPGHVAHLKAARGLGDTLIVSLTADAAVGKGAGRPVIPWADRAAVLRELRCVDQIISVHSGIEAIRLVRPHIFVKGIEYAGQNIKEEATCKALGVEIVYLDTQPVYSSTRLLSGEELNARIRTARASGL